MITINSKIGELTITNKDKKEHYDIWDGNILAAITFDSTEIETKRPIRCIYAIFDDMQMAKQLAKKFGYAFGHKETTEISLNLFYASAKKLITIFTKYFGLKVECYYEEVK